MEPRKEQCPTCKYIHIDHGEDSYRDLDNEPFISIRGSFFAQTSDSGYGSDGVEEVSLYACPKCGALRLFHWEIPAMLDPNPEEGDSEV